MKRFLALLVAALFTLTSCGGVFDTVIGGEIITFDSWDEGTNPPSPPNGNRGENDGSVTGEYNGDFGDGGVTAEVTDIGFEHVDENLETNITVTCTDGTPNAYTLEDGVVTIHRKDGGSDMVFAVTYGDDSLLLDNQRSSFELTRVG